MGVFRRRSLQRLSYGCSMNYNTCVFVWDFYKSYYVVQVLTTQQVQSIVYFSNVGTHLSYQLKPFAFVLGLGFHLFRDFLVNYGGL